MGEALPAGRLEVAGAVEVFGGGESGEERLLVAGEDEASRPALPRVAGAVAIIGAER